MTTAKTATAINTNSNILLSDYLSTFQETHFAKYILTYLRLKETAQFTEEMNISRHSRSLLIDSSDSLTDYENYEKSPIVEDAAAILWSNVVATLNYCKDNNRTRELLTNCNKILRLHVDHNIRLDTHSLRIMTTCTQPRLIEKLFNSGLVRHRDLKHVECLLGTLFKDMASLTGHLDTINPLVNAMTVLLYKARCGQKELILSSLYRLAAFVNSEDALNDQVLASVEWQIFKKSGFKRLLKSAYLNGVFSKGSLNRLLSFTSRGYDSDEESDAEWGWFLEDSVDENNNRIEGRRFPRRPLGERISTQGYSQEINGMFVMSLKDLARIRVKNSMVEYGKRSVGRLAMLPRDLRRFLLFQDEIDCVLRV